MPQADDKPAEGNEQNAAFREYYEKDYAKWKVEWLRGIGQDRARRSRRVAAAVSLADK